MHPQDLAPTSSPPAPSDEIRGPGASRAPVPADADSARQGDIHAALNPRQRQAAQWGQFAAGRFLSLIHI